MKIDYFLPFLAFMIVSVRSENQCNNPQSSRNYYSVSVKDPFPTVGSRIGEDINSVQQTQLNDLYCLSVLDKLVASQWQEYIDRISVKDLGNFSTVYNIPTFSDLYSNPEHEWLLDGGMAYNKLDKCFRNLVSEIVPKMNDDEISCLNRIYPDYLTREFRSAKQLEKYIAETSREQLPFRAVYTYYEITELLFENKNIDSLDQEVREIYEDMGFYIKTEDDKSVKQFVIEQECEWKNARLLKEATSENERYKKFAQIVKSLVNRYLASHVIQKWVPGAIIPEYRYNLWHKSRKTMEDEILKESTVLRKQKKDAQFLCLRAAQLATKFFTDQRAILFEGMRPATLSTELKVRGKLEYVVALENVLSKTKDNRLSHVQGLVKQFREGDYCLTNFVRMVENHQRYIIASSFTDEVVVYGTTYCLIKEMSAKLMNPRYCKCQGTFCEGFGLATLRAERFQLIRLDNGTYKVITDPSYRVIPADPLIDFANNRIKDQKFDTWYYRHQHHHHNH